MFSRACVQWPGLGRHFIGEPDGQFEPLPYYVVRTRLSDIGSYAEYLGDEDAGFWQKDFRTAGITSVPSEVMRLRRDEVGTILAQPAIGFAVGNNLLVAGVPRQEIEEAGDTYQFMMRIGRETLRVVAGILTEHNELWARGEVTAGEIVPVGELPPGIPLH